MLYYCPFESREDRYTMQLSAPEWGWNERAWREHGIEYKRVEGFAADSPEVAGTIFDLPRRSRWCLGQISELLVLYENGGLTKNDVIYFDDFLHPGIEALALSIPRDEQPAKYAWMHGTALDSYDMLNLRDGLSDKRWARAYERLNLRLLDGVFVATPSLKNLVTEGHGKYSYPDVVSKVHATGHIWCTEEVKSRMPKAPLPRQNLVVFASRWDSCKDPGMFLRLARKIRSEWEGDVPPTFAVCSSANEITSDRPELVDELLEAKKRGDVILWTGLTKNEYYEMLSTAKVVFSASRMDWTSYVLLEGACAGAYPVFPFNHCFVDALRGDLQFMYQVGNLDSAASYVKEILLAEYDLWSPEKIEERSWIYKQFDETWSRRLSVMGLCCEHISYSPWEE